MGIGAYKELKHRYLESGERNKGIAVLIESIDSNLQNEP